MTPHSLIFTSVLILSSNHKHQHRRTFDVLARYGFLIVLVPDGKRAHLVASMEPFTALGLAAAIVQFVEFGCKLLSTTREIHISSQGLSKDHETLDGICSDLCFLVDELDEAADVVSGNKQGIQEEVALQQLSKACKNTALELQDIIKKLYRTPGGSIASLRQALRVTWGARKVSDVETRLKEYRLELMAHLIAITRYATCSHTGTYFVGFISDVATAISSQVYCESCGS